MTPKKENGYGPDIATDPLAFLLDDRASGRRYWQALGGTMTIIYLLGLIMAVALAVFLFVALLKPELFS